MNILEAIERGVDMFDCVMPTRNGRNGQIFTWRDDQHPQQEVGRTTSRRRSGGDDLRPPLLESLPASSGDVRRDDRARRSPSLHNIAFYLGWCPPHAEHIRRRFQVEEADGRQTRKKTASEPD